MQKRWLFHIGESLRRYSYSYTCMQSLKFHVGMYGHIGDKVCTQLCDCVATHVINHFMIIVDSYIAS